MHTRRTVNRSGLWLAWPPDLTGLSKHQAHLFQISASEQRLKIKVSL
jgi:hypothetical protein